VASPKNGEVINTKLSVSEGEREKGSKMKVVLEKSVEKRKGGEGGNDEGKEGAGEWECGGEC